MLLSLGFVCAVCGSFGIFDYCFMIRINVRYLIFVSFFSVFWRCASALHIFECVKFIFWFSVGPQTCSARCQREERTPTAAARGNKVDYVGAP